MLERFSYIFLLFKPPWFDRYRHVFAFVWKSKMLCIYQFTPSFSSPQLFGNIGKFVTKKYLTDHRTANTIQLFFAIKGNFSGLFFTAAKNGQFPRD